MTIRPRDMRCAAAAGLPRGVNLGRRTCDCVICWCWFCARHYYHAHATPFSVSLLRQSKAVVPQVSSQIQEEEVAPEKALHLGDHKIHATAFPAAEPGQREADVAVLLHRRYVGRLRACASFFRVSVSLFPTHLAHPSFTTCSCLRAVHTVQMCSSKMEAPCS